MSKLFLGGVPTGPDVKAIREAIPVVNPGDEFSHDVIAGIIGCDMKSSRYKTVTTAWRKTLLANDNLEVSAIPSFGFRVLTADERVTTNVKSFQQGTRKQARSLRRVATVRRDDLSQPNAAKLDHLNRFGARIIETATSMMREIQPVARQEQLPRSGLAPAQNAALARSNERNAGGMEK